MIVDSVARDSGRFLKKDPTSGEWYEIDDRSSREKNWTVVEGDSGEQSNKETRGEVRTSVLRTRYASSFAGACIFEARRNESFNRR